MATQQSSTNLIADRYASALYELSSESKCIDEVLNDLLTVQEYIKQNNDFKLLIKSPHISSNEKIYLMCNGEIYGYKNLVKEFKIEDKLRSHSDCEILLHLYMIAFLLKYICL